ncbi:hypothetical protein SRDD_33620 [Serratia sp. DD3]|nr:hypothetical protein SRDD_33620 [Serratia sp. DD3]
MEAGAIYGVGPAVTGDIPVKFIPIGEAAKMVTDLILDLIVIDTGLQQSICATHAYCERFIGSIQAIGLGKAVT